MGYYLFRFKDKPTDKDYNIKVFVNPAFYKDFALIANKQDCLITWMGEEVEHDDEVEMKGMQAYLEKQRLFYKYSPWWKDTAIENKFNKKSPIGMDRLHAAYICNNFLKGELSIDEDATKKKGYEPVYKTEWEDIDGKNFTLTISSGEIEELISKRNLYAEKEMQLKETISKLQEFVQNNNINSKGDFHSRVKPKQVDTADENDLYSDKSYIDLE